MISLIRLAAFLLLGASALGAQAPVATDPVLVLAQAQPPTQQDEFIPIDELPPQEQLAAAPLLIGAYVFVLLVLFGYLLSVSRRLVGIERDMARLEAEVARGGKG